MECKARETRYCFSLGWQEPLFRSRNKGEDQMLPFNEVPRIYDPDALKMMTTALDQACRFLPANFENSERARRRLAFLIIRHVDHGEYDPSCISDSVATQFLSWSGS